MRFIDISCKNQFWGKEVQSDEYLDKELFGRTRRGNSSEELLLYAHSRNVEFPLLRLTSFPLLLILLARVKYNEFMDPPGEFSILYL